MPKLLINNKLCKFIIEYNKFNATYLFKNALILRFQVDFYLPVIGQSVCLLTCYWRNSNLIACLLSSSSLSEGVFTVQSGQFEKKATVS